MAASDQDHNYYSQTNRRHHHLDDYSVDGQGQAAQSNIDDLPLLPALHYRQSQQYQQRPTLDTNLDNYTANTNANTNILPSLGERSAPDASPDPYEFYRPFRDSLRDRSSVYGSLDIGLGQQEQEMASTRPPQRTPLVTSRLNGTPATPRWASPSEKSPPSNKPSTVPSFARGRKPSLKELVNKFENTTDEVPPLPSNPASRSTSANPSPSSSHAAKSFRSRTSSETLKSRKVMAPKRTMSPQEQTTMDKVRQTSIGTTVGELGSRRSHKQPPVASNAIASQSTTNLGEQSVSHPPKPLFGEIMANGQPDLGYGIPGSRVRRGSEGNAYRPNPMFHDDTALRSRKVSPSSPTAWYMGVTPTLEGIDFDKPIPPKRPELHRRSRSDIAAGHYAAPPVSSAWSKNVTIMSPPQEQHSSDSSPPSSRQNSKSRIPTNKRRPSNNLRSGTVTPPIPNSQPAYNGTRSKTPTKSGSTMPLPLDLKTPDRRSSTRYSHILPAQSSPRLEAFISEPPPAKSPPLRSSRPRQSVATATTSASRSRVAAAQQEKDKGHKIMPELGGVDLATRRERIQRAFTTKMKEREIETKRMSLLQDAQWQRRRDKMAREDEHGVPMTAPPISKPSFENLRGGENELFTVVSTRRKEDSYRAVKLETKNAAPVFDRDQGDSPTLGTAPFLEPVRYDGSAQSSAQTSGTAEAFFESEPRQSQSVDFEEVLSAENTPSVLSRPSVSREISDRSRFGTAFYNSDLDDGESIHIMLQDGPSNAKETQLSPEHRDPVASAIMQVDGGADETREGHPERTTQSQHESISTMASSTEQSPWSPGAESSVTTLRDSDTYNNINHVLDDYHQSSFLNSENINEFRQRLFSQSPQLARQGNWDPKKVTQLYLQNYGQNKNQHKSAIPAPLDLQQKSQSESQLQDLDSEKVAIPPADGEYPEVRMEQEATKLRAPENYSHRASASLSNADDWLNTSPSMLDWMAHQSMDTPVEEKNAKSLAFDLQAATSRPDTDKSLPVLPGIQTSNGLGIDITVQSPHEGPSGLAAQQNSSDPSPSRIRSSPMRPDAIPRPESPTLRSATPASNTPSKYSSTKSGSLASHESPSRKNSEDSSQRPQRPRAGTETAQTSIDTFRSEAPTAALSPEDQKRLNKRKHILKEIVDTESVFGKDMTVVVDIYQGTSNVILGSSDDVKILFGNSADIVQFSTNFLDSLKQAVKSVYVLPKDKRWKAKRDSNATSGSTTTADDQSLAGIDLSDDDKDRRTSVGAAFDQHMTQMEKVYTEYLKNHEAAAARLLQLQKSEKVTIWLKECQSYAHDLTQAWNLDSLLVKPVQRVLKYPLLLNELLSVTPENHPDYVAIDNAAREMVGVSKRINEAKKRADLVEQVNNSSNAPQNSKKKKDSESRSILPKYIGRRAEKMKQQVGATETVQDRKYDDLETKFGPHYVQLQVVMRDMELYIEKSQEWVVKFYEFIGSVEAIGQSGPTTYTEIESKWNAFKFSIREIQLTALTDHLSAVRKHVVEPMNTCLGLYAGPQRLMEKRKKRVMDFAKFKSIKDSGQKPDKKTTELSEMFIAVNDTLKDELPRLFSLTGKLVEACLQNFVQLQLQWMNIWRAKLRQSIESHEIPPSFEAAVPSFKVDFDYVEAQLVQLGICNGSLANDHVNLLNYQISPAPSQISGPSYTDELRRPSMNDDVRSRAASNATATTEQTRPRGLSSSTASGPTLAGNDYGRTSDSFGSNNIPYNPSSYAQMQHPQQRPRIRANSSNSARTPISPEQSSSWRTQPGASNHPNRPSTGTGRSYDSPSTRPSYESGRPSNERLAPEDSYRYGREGQSSPNPRQSRLFSSAMPMSDTSRPSSPMDDSQHPQQYNVLFLAASVYEFNIDRARREAGYPYLTYVAGEIFDVIGEKGELWLAKNQDDATNQIGWIWNKHFAKLAS